MPTKKESWSCVHCDFTYPTEKEAVECENGHALIVEANAIFVDGRRYPSQVNVILTDGVVMQFSTGTIISAEGVIKK